MKMLKAKQVEAIFGHSVSRIYVMIKEGKFPRGQKRGVSVRWADYFIEAYTILYWNLDRELPPLSENEKAILQQCLENVKNSLEPPLFLCTKKSQ